MSEQTYPVRTVRDGNFVENQVDLDTLNRIQNLIDSDTVETRETTGIGDIVTDDFFVVYRADRAEDVQDRILAWFKEHECFSGESIMQSDEPQLTAADLLSGLADEVFQFEVAHSADDELDALELADDASLSDLSDPEITTAATSENDGDTLTPEA